MLQEIYSRAIDDPNYRGDLETSDTLEAVLGQIRMILMTKKGEVMGDPDFGVSLEELIYEMNLNEYALRKRIDEQVQKYCTWLDVFTIDYDIRFYPGELRDGATIDILINQKRFMGFLVK